MIRKLVLSLVAVLGVAAASVAQNVQVSGKVSGVDGLPIIGAAVLVEGTTTGASTGIDGDFTLKAPANGNLLVSFLGYESQTVPINGQTMIEIILKEETEVMDEVIVVAFGQAKKEAFTGSAGVIKSDDISKVQTSNVAQALAGQVAGVQLSNTSGAPGSEPSIRVRGFSSITAGQEPLYIVDGAPYEGDLNNINPSDIESMTVLKDAASNALYGARGANGVIMITTKRAKGQDAIVTVDAKWGVNSQALQTYDYIKDPAAYYEAHYAALYNYYTAGGNDANTAMQMANAAMINDPEAGLGYQVFTVPEGQYFIGPNGKVNPNATLGNKIMVDGQEYLLTADDWYDEAYRTSLRQEYNVSVSGATDRSNFYASAGYLNNKGIVEGSDMNRLTARLKADFQAKKWLKVGMNANFTHFNWNSLSDDGVSNSTGNVFAFTSNVAPIYPVYVRDGEGNIMVDEHGLQIYDYGSGENAGLTRPIMTNANALQSSKLDKNHSEGNAFIGSAFADINFLPNLKLTVNASVNLDETRSTSSNNKYYGQFSTMNGVLSKGHGRTISYNTQQLLNYNTTIADLHALDVMVGHEYYVLQSASLNAAMSGLLLDDNYELANAITTIGTNSSTGKYNVEGYFARLQYDFDGRVFASASYRRDASSRFHPDHRWGNFWSIGGAWLINRENWYDVKWLDMLKLKLSYGSQGNDGIPSYLYTDTYLIGNYNGNPSLSFNRKGSENITWETNGNLNAGIEFDMFHGRLSGSFDYFYRTTTDMLFSFPVAPSMGYSSIYANVGDMRNSGIELSLNGVLLATKDVVWMANLNMTHMKNKITMLPEEFKTARISKNTGTQTFNDDEPAYDGYMSSAYFYGEGQSLYTFYMRQYAGVDSKTGESLWYMQNDEGDRVTTNNWNEADYYLCGNAIPDLYGGFGTSLSFFGVDFAVNFTYQIGGQVYDSGYAGLMSSPTPGAVGASFHEDILKGWSKEGDVTTIPRLRYATEGNDQYVSAMSDRFLVDASYLNIQNLQLGYTFPQKWTSKLGLGSLRVYLSCDNIYYWSYRKGLDPRQSFSGGTSNATYAPVRTISGGLTVQF